VRFTVNQFVLGLAIVLALPILGVGSVARAGYMPIQTEASTDTTETRVNTSKDLSSQAPGQTAEQSGAGQGENPSPPSDNNKPEIRDLPDNPFARLNTSTGGCSSGASSPSSSAGVPVSANLIQLVICPVLVSWLGEENLVFSNSPVASGMFHPPRA
jgi:hypothetical protein